MKGVAIVIGVFVILVLLVGSGVVGGAICINNVGCLASNGNGLLLDDRESVTVTTGRR